MIRIKKGLDLPIAGHPQQSITETKTPKHVALIGPDYVGMKPTMKVKVGDSVKKGDILFSDKKNPEVVFTSPAAGKVKEVNRGLKRVFQSLVIELQGSDELTFKSHSETELENLQLKDIKEQLIQSGLWTSLRQRPFSSVPSPKTTPKALFVTSMDTNPLGVNASVVIKQKETEYQAGLKIVAKLTSGKCFVCTAPKIDFDSNVAANIEVHEFSGPHPAGLVGTHIHNLYPVNLERHVWHLNYQDVIAIGHLFLTGKISSERVVAIGGPECKNPRLIKTVVGAKISEIMENEHKGNQTRLISGSVLSGRKAKDAFDFLGRFHQQVSAIKEDHEREFLGWQKPGLDKFSVKNMFVSKLLPGKLFNFTSSTHGSLRSIVPIGSFEKVMPLDILPTYLLRSLAAVDTDRAQELGCLELDEEDLALCTFVDPCKNEYGPMLRKTLTIIEKEG